MKNKFVIFSFFIIILIWLFYLNNYVNKHNSNEQDLYLNSLINICQDNWWTKIENWNLNEESTFSSNLTDSFVLAKMKTSFDFQFIDLKEESKESNRNYLFKKSLEKYSYWDKIYFSFKSDKKNDFILKIKRGFWTLENEKLIDNTNDILSYEINLTPFLQKDLTLSTGQFWKNFQIVFIDKNKPSVWNIISFSYKQPSNFQSCSLNNKTCDKYDLIYWKNIISSCYSKIEELNKESLNYFEFNKIWDKSFENTNEWETEVCWTGYHIPSKKDFEALIEENNIKNAYNFRTNLFLDKTGFIPFNTSKLEDKNNIYFWLKDWNEKSQNILFIDTVNEKISILDNKENNKYPIRCFKRINSIYNPEFINLSSLYEKYMNSFFNKE